jgi:microcystin degradation protein MlrC
VPLTSIPEALQRLPSLPPGVIVMADRNDSVTAGFPGDSPEIIRQLLERNVRDRACVIVNDPEFVRLALQAGVGHEVAGPLGGKWGGALYGPVNVRAHVRLLSDGTLLQGDDTSPGHLSVSNSSMGITAVVEINGTITVVVTSVPVMSTEPAVYRSVGVEPREYRIVVTKSVAQQRYNFASIASGFIDLDGPGWLKVAATYPWKKRPPMAIYPHAPVTEHTIRRLLGLEHRPVDSPLKETV